MIATTRGLVVLAVVTLLLAILVAVVGPRKHAALDRTLVPGFDASTVTELVFERPGEPAIHVTRKGTSWSEPDATVDTSTIDAVLAALRGARWHRTASVATAGTARAILHILGGRSITISVGSELPGAEQTWLVRDGRAMLVDSWVARALAPDRLALRVRRPLAATQLTPAEVRKRRGVWPDPALLDQLRTALDGIEIVSLDGHADPQPGEEILTAQRIGFCDHERVLIKTPEGSGCVEKAAWDSLSSVFAALERRPPEQIADRRPLPFEPARLEVPAGGGNIVVELGGHPRVGGEDADPDRIRELVVALTTAGELVPRPAGPPAGNIVAIAPDGTRLTLELYPQAVARQGEPVAIRTPALKILREPVAALRDPTRWREDPTTISSITLDGVTYTRGAVLGEWARKPAGAVDAALVEALASSLAAVRAPAASAPARPVHHLSVTFTPPAGAPTSHSIELGPPTARGCDGTLDRIAVTLPLELCTAVLSLAGSG